MRTVLCAVTLVLSLMYLAPEAAAADADAASQPSTDRIVSHVDMRRSLDAPGGVTVLDLRRNADYDKDEVTMPQAKRHDPDKIAEWANTLPKDKEILLYCAHGRSISNASVDYLVKNGFRARFVAGGFDAWKAGGGATTAKAR